MDTLTQIKSPIDLLPNGGDEATPVFAGTTVPIQTLIDHLEIGDTIDGFAAEWPAVSRSQVIDFLMAARDRLAADARSGADPACSGCEGAETGQGSGPDGGLAPYTNWQSRVLPDPRTAPLSEIVKGLVEIIGAEGPILAYRAYTVYARSIGLQAIREETKARFTRALRRAVDTEEIVESDETTPEDSAYRFVRTAGAPPIIPRTRGDRKIEEIPPLEIAAHMRQVSSEVESLDQEGVEWLFRAVLDRYDLVRMTANTKSVLLAALDLARDSARWERPD